MFYYGSMHQLISWIVLSFGFISDAFLCLYLCSFYLYLVYDLIININIAVEVTGIREEQAAEQMQSKWRKGKETN